MCASGIANVSCAPDDMSNRRFYETSNPQSPKWYINATNWGHVDFMDPIFQVK